VFDPRGHYRRSLRVGLRPEPFGALAYHYDTRRLVFLKSTELVDLVDSLESHPTADAAVDALVGADGDRRPAYLKALGSLVEAGIVEVAPPAVRADVELAS
jgi:putative mycofactocin binding protein MftB